MRSARSCMLGAALTLAIAGAGAQPAPPEPPKTPEKSAGPAKPAKPAAPKKAAAKSAGASKADARKTSPKKPGPAAKPAPKVYRTGPRELRDKDGNVIPTSPDAYNVDSAMPPKPRK